MAVDIEVQSRLSGGVARAKHVVLIRPAMISSVGTWSSPITPPLGLAYLAAVLEKDGVRVSVIDGLAERVDQFREEDGYVFQGLTIAETVARIPADVDLIGVSCMFSQDWPWVRSLIQAIRARFPATPIVAGGEHVTALPEFSLGDCPQLDACVLGEGEETLRELVAQLDERDAFPSVAGLVFRALHGPVHSPPRARIRNVDDLPWPAWHLFPMEAYVDSRNAHGVYRGRTIGVLATRGCPYKCTFCSNPVMYGNLWMPRDPGDVLNEIEHAIRTWGIENVDFYDLTFILRRSWILEFCRQIESRGLKFTWQLPTGTRSEVIDAEVSRALYRTGCRNITYAPESGSDETLRVVKKQVDLKKVEASIRAALSEKIHVKINMVIGFPHESRREIMQTLWFCWRMAVVGVHDAGVFLFSPYPGSALFDELRAEGRIPALDATYFRSLVAFMDPFAPSEYCRHVRGRELALWRFFAMASFFAVSYAVRPWRFAQLIVNLARNRSETVLEQRLGAILRRPKAQHSAAPAPAEPASV